MSVSFARIGISIVGPLTKASSRHKFLLVLVHYVTPYPKAILLRNKRAEMIAKELVQVFMRGGIPKQVITDQGTSIVRAPFRPTPIAKKEALDKEV